MLRMSTRIIEHGFNKWNLFYLVFKKQGWLISHLTNEKSEFLRDVPKVPDLTGFKTLSLSRQKGWVLRPIFLGKGSINDVLHYMGNHCILIQLASPSWGGGYKVPGEEVK